MSKIKTLAGLLSSKASLAALGMALFLPVFTGSFPLCVYVSSSLLVRTLVMWLRAPPTWSHFNIVTILKTLSPNTVMF